MTDETTLPDWLTRVGVFDLETTGVDVSTDRIVTAHVGVLDAKGRQIAARSWIADPGIPIPDGAAAIHGFTTERVRRDGRPSAEVVAEIAGSLRALLTQGVPVVAYNASYDFSLLFHECLRHGIEPLQDPSPVIDPLVIDKAVDRYRRGKRTLEVVAEHYSVTLDGAHEASADAIAAGRVAQALARRFDLPRRHPNCTRSRSDGRARRRRASRSTSSASGASTPKRPSTAPGRCEMARHPPEEGCRGGCDLPRLNA